MKNPGSKVHLALMACATMLALGPASAEQSTFPQEGTAFIYNDGRVERFLRADGETQIWATRAGREYQRSANPVLPILAWEIGDRSGRAEVYGNAAMLWPPAKGRRTQFRVMQVSRDGVRESRSVQAWRCRVGKMSDTPTPAGVLPAYPITCDLYSVATMRLVEKRTWWWSPDVGHYVRRKFQSMRTGKVSEISLCAALPQTRANSVRIDALIKAC